MKAQTYRWALKYCIELRAKRYKLNNFTSWKIEKRMEKENLEKLDENNWRLYEHQIILPVTNNHPAFWFHPLISSTEPFAYKRNTSKTKKKKMEDNIVSITRGTTMLHVIE